MAVFGNTAIELLLPGHLAAVQLQAIHDPAVALFRRRSIATEVQALLDGLWLSLFLNGGGDEDLVALDDG